MVNKVVSDESSSESSSEIQNSATEISTDSEFAQDDPTPTREVPSIMLNDFHVTKVRGSGGNHAPKRIQVTTGYLQRPSNGRPKRPSIELNLKPLVPHTPLVKKPAPVLLPRTQGYALNRTQSTGGIAAKVSLELKKKYLLGESTPGAIQKSGSASTLDTTFKTFHSKISDCQKLLKPAPEISASMQTFCNKLNERKSPILSPQSSIIFPKVPEPTKEVEESSKPTDSVFVNESEGRPRSPVHETSIIVPQIDWSKKEQSLSSDSLATSSSEDDVSSKPKFDNIPRVEVHTANDVEEKEDIPLDSLLIEVETPAQSESTKSITSEKKSLNQPKQLPNLETLLPDIHNALHMKNQRPEILEIEALKNSSGISSPESGGEQATAALTETELSDWARDEAVSDGFEDADFESEKQDKERDPKVPAKIAKMAEFDDLGHVCSKEKAPVGLKNKIILTEAMNNILGSNLDNIEFMDTGTETSSEDGQVDSQNGYVLFKNEDEFAEDSLNPNINEIVEATNLHILEKDEIKNSGYCVIAEEEVKQAKRNDLEDDSLLNVETGTTTEENTCSDSTVKNVTEITVDKKQVEAENNNISEVAINNEQNKNEQKESSQKDTIEFSEHCQRLQSKIEFGNVKDSIDIRKSRRKSKSEALQKPDLIQEETTENQKDVTLKLTPTPHTPDILYRKDIIQKERDVNQKLVQEMVMNKMLAEHKSLERKKRNRSSQSPYSLTKSATTDIVSQINLNNLDANLQSTYSTSSTYNTPDVLLSTNLIPLQNSKSVNTMPELNMSTDSLSTPAKDQNRPTSLYARFTEKAKSDIKNSPVTATSVPDDTPKAPPRQHRSVDDVNRKLEKLKQCVKARGKENENQALLDSERNNSWLYSNDNLYKKKNAFKRSKSGDCGSQTKICSDHATSVPVRTKSIPELQNKTVQIHDIDYETERKKICKSDPNILESEQKNKKKSKDRERRKSITKIITSLFTKKSPNSGSKGLFSKLSPKSKDMSKVLEEPVRRKSLSEANIPRNIVTPPPIPPLPTNYSVKATDESSDGEYENKGLGHSSCDTLDQSGLVENSMSSLTSRRSCKSKKAIRYAQRSIAKRHRMAQEIQRKLEETEVKTKELEMRGVEVEKALRGEDGGECSKDESDLLQEWFDLMRDRTELRRYERELSIRAQELELEDRHARLQHELRDRLENEGAKKEEDLKKEKSIIKEMMDIVAQRDSLVAVIEEERLRCTTEDHDLEEQMLAKGLRLTPIKTSPEK